MTLSFKGFVKYTKKPNTVSFGTLFTKDIDIPFAPQRKRTLRVWLPEDYDGKKRFPVFYFSDGQNIVDRYTSPYGEWELDERIHEYIQSGHQGLILVGIDCPNDSEDRESEYRPSFAKIRPFLKIRRKHPDYAEEYADYVVNEIKPLIDKTFLTKSEREYTGFGGASMGGLFSFFITNKYNDIFSMSLSFSPAFMFYTKTSAKKYLYTLKNNDIRIAFFAGRVGKLEKTINYWTNYYYKVLIEVGYKKDHILLMLDKSKTHNEAAWSEYVIPAIEFLLK